MELGKTIYRLRKEKGFTQESFAEALGVSRQAVSKWEREEAYPDLFNIKNIADLLEVSVDDLLNRNNPNALLTETVPNKVALSFLLLPTILLIVGNITLVILIHTPMAQLIISLFLVLTFLYCLSYIKVYVGENGLTHKRLLILYSFINLTLYIIMIITGAFPDSIPGLIIMLILLSVLVLGSIGAFMLNPSTLVYKPLVYDKIQKVLKPLSILLIIGLGLIFFGIL